MMQSTHFHVHVPSPSLLFGPSGVDVSTKKTTIRDATSIEARGMDYLDGCSVDSQCVSGRQVICTLENTRVCYEKETQDADVEKHRTQFRTVWDACLEVISPIRLRELVEFTCHFKAHSLQEGLRFMLCTLTYWTATNLREDSLPLWFSTWLETSDSETGRILETFIIKKDSFSERLRVSATTFLDKLYWLSHGIREEPADYCE